MADNPTPTVNFDKRDYTFGKVGETKYIYINNDKFTITKDTSTSTGPVSNNNVFTKTFHCWHGSRGFYDNSFPYAERANGENASKILNGWYFNNWAGITDPTNDPSYTDAKNSEWGKTNLEKWPMTANTWETIDANYIEPFCRFKFSIQDMLPVGLSLDNIDVKKISGYILIQQENYNIADTYQVVRVLSRQTTDENGWYWQSTECLFYWAQSYSSSYTDYPSETVNFEAHIIEGQKNLFIDIAARCPKSESNKANMIVGKADNNSLRFEFVCQSIEYADKFDGNIYTAPNTDMVYISAAGTTITKFAALNNNVNRENNKVTLGSDVVLTTLKSGSTYITIDWLAGKIIDSSGSSKDFTINSSTEQEINSWLQIYSDVRAIEIIKNGLSSSYTIEIENTRSSSTVVNSINYSLAEIQNNIKDVKEDKIQWQQILYRIGDVITTTDGTLNPATRYGGSWELLTSGVPSILLKSYTKGTKWARFYSDGTLMQGDTVFVGTGDIQSTLVKFPFKFANTEYSLTASPSDVNKDGFSNNYRYSIDVTTNGAELGWGPRTTDSIYFGLDGGYSNNAQWISYTVIGEFNPDDNQITKGLTLNKKVEYRWRKVDNVADGDGFSTPLTVENVTYYVGENVSVIGDIKWEMSCKEEDMLEKGFVPCSGKKIEDLEGINPDAKVNLAQILYGADANTSKPIPSGANNILLGTGGTQVGDNQWYEIYWGGKLVQGGRVDDINSNSNFNCEFKISYNHTNYTPHITFLHTNYLNTPDLNEYGYIKKLEYNSLYCYQSNGDKGWSCLWTTMGTLNNTDPDLLQARTKSVEFIPYIKVFYIDGEVRPKQDSNS